MKGRSKNPDIQYVKEPTGITPTFGSMATPTLTLETRTTRRRMRGLQRCCANRGATPTH